MKTSAQPAVLTQKFARVLGPFLAIASTVVIFRAPEMEALAADFASSALWPWVMGAFGLMGGISIVAFHQLWRDPAAIMISTLGWVLVARGFLLLAFPDSVATAVDRSLGGSAAWLVVYIGFAVAGLYLTYVGYRHAALPTLVSDPGS